MAHFSSVSGHLTGYVLESVKMVAPVNQARLRPSGNIGGLGSRFRSCYTSVQAANAACANMTFWAAEGKVKQRSLAARSDGDDVFAEGCGTGGLKHTPSHHVHEDGECRCPIQPHSHRVLRVHREWWRSGGRVTRRCASASNANKAW
jgi:hypothetical protein